MRRTKREFAETRDIADVLNLGPRQFRTRARAMELAPIVSELRASGLSAERDRRRTELPACPDAQTCETGTLRRCGGLCDRFRLGSRRWHWGPRTLSDETSLSGGKTSLLTTTGARGNGSAARRRDLSSNGLAFGEATSGRPEGTVLCRLLPGLHQAARPVRPRLWKASEQTCFDICARIRGG